MKCSPSGSQIGKSIERRMARQVRQIPALQVEQPDVIVPVANVEQDAVPVLRDARIVVHILRNAERFGKIWSRLTQTNR